MIVTLREAKEYLRIDFDDEDELIARLIESAQNLCMSIARIDASEDFEKTVEVGRIAVLYTVAYLYEHREEADHRELTLTLRSLLFGIRKEGF